MWMDEETKRLYTIGLVQQRNEFLDNGRQMEQGTWLSSYLPMIRRFTGDDLCLDEGVIGKRTNHLKLIALLGLGALLVLFGMIFAFARL